MRAVTSAEDVDPRVQEVLDLPVLNLATMQSEDPDLVFVKELLQEQDVRPTWNNENMRIMRIIRLRGSENTVDSIP